MAKFNQRQEGYLFTRQSCFFFFLSVALPYWNVLFVFLVFAFLIGVCLFCVCFALLDLNLIGTFSLFSGDVVVFFLPYILECVSLGKIDLFVHESASSLELYNNNKSRRLATVP